MRHQRGTRWAAAGLAFTLGLAFAQTPPPPVADPLAGGSAADLELSFFGNLLQLGDGKEDTYFFDLNLLTVIAGYKISGQYGQVLRLCQYWESVAKSNDDRAMALSCQRDSLSALGRYSESELLAARARLLLPGEVHTTPGGELVDLGWMADLTLNQGSSRAAERVYAKLLQKVPIVINKIRAQPPPEGIEASYRSLFDDLHITAALNMQLTAWSQLAEIAYFRQDFAMYRTRVTALLALPQLDGNAWAVNVMQHAPRLDWLGDHELARDLARRSVLLLKANAGFRDQPEPLTKFETQPAITNALGDERTQRMHVNSWLLLAAAYQLLDRDVEAQALLDGTAVIARRFLLEPESANTLLASVEEAQADLAMKRRNRSQALALLRAARSRLENNQAVERSNERGRRGLRPDDRLLQVNAKILSALSTGNVTRIVDHAQVAELAAIAAEFSSSRASLSATLSARQASSPDQQAALANESRLIDEMVDLRGAMMSSLHSRSPATLEAANRAVARLAQIYDELARLKTSSAMDAGSIALGPNQFADALGPQVAYWQWLTHAEGNFVLSWTKDGVTFAPLTAPYSDIRHDVLKLQANVNLRDVRLRSQLEPFSRERAFALYRDLFGEIPAQSVTASSWILAISPLVDGLPWGALRLRDATTEGGPRWLIERADLTVVPSWKSWLALRSRPAASGSMDLLAVGDPVLPLTSKPFAEELAVRGAYLAKTLDLPAVASKQDSTFAQELRVVSRLFPAQRTVVLSQGEATKTKLKALRLADFRMVLFSTHGHLGQEFAMSIGPSLELTASGNTPGSRYLSANEVAKFQLDADLVILSACDTSGSDGFDDSEGFSGLTSALLLAGARDVIATLWPVETETTRVIITSTLRNRVQDSDASAARALQRATLELLRSGDDWQKHPAYWAPFLVVGK